MSGTPAQPSSAWCPMLEDSRASAVSWHGCPPSTHTPEAALLSLGGSKEVQVVAAGWVCAALVRSGATFWSQRHELAERPGPREGRSQLALAPAAVTGALDAQNSPGAGPRGSLSSLRACAPPDLSSCTKEGVAAPQRCRLPAPRPSLGQAGASAARGGSVAAEAGQHPCHCCHCPARSHARPRTSGA